MSAVGMGDVLDRGILACPSCASAALLPQQGEVSGGRYKCMSCGHVCLEEDGVLDLRLDTSFDTLLDVEQYDAAHHVTDDSARLLARLYSDIVTGKGKAATGKVLEIGAGSGNLTSGLAEHSTFTEIYCSDLSPGFMRLLRQRIDRMNCRNPVRFYLLDANELPFVDGSFDFVFGHSILHHLAHFERAIAAAHRVMKPGGIAVFGEPVMDTNALISLAAGTIRMMDTVRAVPAFTRREHAILEVIARRSLEKRANMEGDRNELRQIEDKFMFALADMRHLARELGYSDFDCISPHVDKGYGAAVKAGLVQIFRQCVIDPAKLDPYQAVFENLEMTLGPVAGRRPVGMFSYFVFIK
ncbi:MAG: class I SAM-dependent methyltransferase [Oceanibaculum sp.]